MTKNSILAAFILFLIAGCATVERVPLQSTNDEKNTGPNVTIYFFNQEPHKTQLVRKVVWPKNELKLLWRASEQMDENRCRSDRAVDCKL
ncbi:MAG: hypothetical protein AAF402_07650 [Pseudomonadota bacterium]